MSILSAWRSPVSCLSGTNRKTLMKNSESSIAVLLMTRNDTAEKRCKISPATVNSVLIRAPEIALAVGVLFHGNLRLILLGSDLRSTFG